jgi:hypothetical protein
VWVSDRLEPVAYPLAAVYAAIHRYVLWCHLPSQRSADVTEGGTAHFLVVSYNAPSPAKKVANIKGGSLGLDASQAALLSPLEDKNIACAWGGWRGRIMTHARAGVVRRLKRADGHFHQIVAMVEEEQPALSSPNSSRRSKTRSTMPRRP